MRKLFLDTNIMMDFFLDRFPFSEPASKVIYLGEDNKVMLYVSPISFPTIYYMMKKNNSHNQLMKMFKEFNQKVKVISVGKKMLGSSLDSRFSDFEDAMQYFSAKNVKGMGAIITRNKKDFLKSEIPVMTAAEYLQTFN